VSIVLGWNRIFPKDGFCSGGFESRAALQPHRSSGKTLTARL